MGWLFGRKKVVPKVPFPSGVPSDEKELRFPSPKSRERVIAPNELKKAVGFEKPVSPPTSPAAPKKEMPAPPVARKPVMSKPSIPAAPPMPRPPEFPQPSPSPFSEGPLFIKKDVYQRLLGEMDDLKHRISDLKEINRSLENSEYNEENKFEKMRRSMRIAHDRLLQIDKVMFKSQGE